MAFHNSRYVAILVLSLTLTSCASVANNILGRQADPVDPTAEFDLSEYLFHDRVRSVDGVVSYKERFFKKDDPSSVAEQYEYRYQNNNNAIEVQAVGLEGLTQRYTLTDATINEARPTMSDSRSFRRYARMGETYLDADFLNANLHENCMLSEFFDTYHLSSATGTLKLSNKTYTNVIKVRCVSEFTNKSTDRGNFRWNIYYAKGIGPVFKDGNWQNYLGQIYSIYDY